MSQLGVMAKDPLTQLQDEIKRSVDHLIAMVKGGYASPEETTHWANVTFNQIARQYEEEVGGKE